MEKEIRYRMDKREMSVVTAYVVSLRLAAVEETKWNEREAQVVKRKSRGRQILKKEQKMQMQKWNQRRRMIMKKM